MSDERVAIVTSAIAMSGTAALQRSFEASQHPADIILLNDGYKTVEQIDKAGSIIFRVSPRSYKVYRDIVLPNLQNKRNKETLSRTLDAFDKGRQAQRLLHGGVLMPDTNVVYNVSMLSPWLPCVLKHPTSNQGKGVFLVKDNNAMVKIATQLIDAAGYCIQQEYIHIRPAADKRLFVVDRSVVAAMRRTASGDNFRSNLHDGGRGDSYTPSSEECATAELAAKCLELPFCGVDIIDSPKGPLVLEVNPSPGFAIADVTGIPVTDIIASHYTKKRSI